MNQDDGTDQSQRQQALSALMDGQAAEADFACRAWRDDAGMRADWHAYHLIGELMRSDDVAFAPRRDALFLGRLRERLSNEPVVLAPAEAAEAVGRRGGQRRAWTAPVAIAAGFVAVAGVVVALRVAVPTRVAPDSVQLASQASASGAQAATGASGASGALGVDGRLIRSAELDRYLAAHKQYSSTSALAVPGGIVRNAAAVAPGR